MAPRQKLIWREQRIGALRWRHRQNERERERERGRERETERRIHELKTSWLLEYLQKD